MESPQVWTHRDTLPPAPGELEIVRRFLSLHDHRRDLDRNDPPSPATLEAFLRDEGLIPSDEAVSTRELREVRELQEALRTRVHRARGGPPGAGALVTIERTARDARLEVRYAADGRPRLEPRAGRVRGALGRILAVAFLAELDGSWSHLRECASEKCTSVFFDGSKNHSRKWCSMQSCGNRSKVRAFRERHRKGAGGGDA